MDKAWKAAIKTGTSGSRKARARVCMCVYMFAFVAVGMSVALGPHNLKGSVADVASLPKPEAVSQARKRWGGGPAQTVGRPGGRYSRQTGASWLPSVEKAHMR